MFNLCLVLVVAPFIHLRTLRHTEGDLPMVPKPMSDRAGILILHLFWPRASSLASIAKATFFPSYAPSHRNEAQLSCAALGQRQKRKGCDVSGLEALGVLGLSTPPLTPDTRRSNSSSGKGICQL